MAVTMNRAKLRQALGVDGDTAERLLDVASALCERYAPKAPEAIANEAVIRTAGYLAEHPSAARISGKVGDVEADYSVGSLSALRHSGGMALLSPWKVRRAGVIG